MKGAAHPGSLAATGFVQPSSDVANHGQNPRHITTFSTAPYQGLRLDATVPYSSALPVQLRPCYCTSPGAQRLRSEGRFPDCQ